MNAKALRVEAARKLLAARQRLENLRLTLHSLEHEYNERDEEYFRVSAPLPMDRPENLLIDGVVIMPREDFYDLKPGTRLSFHTVEIA